MPSRARFRSDERAVSAVEFAVTAPAMLLLMLMGFQVVSYVNAVRKVTLLTNSVAQMITQAAPATPGAPTATVNQLDIIFSAESSFVTFPYLLKDAVRQSVPWYNDISINYASVSFAKTPGAPCIPDFSSCYTANVVWTSSGFYPSTARQCGQQGSMADNAAPNSKSLPKSTFGPGSLIVIDVRFTFQPTFGQKLIPPITIARSAYVQPRYVSLINYATSSDGYVNVCQ